MEDTLLAIPVALDLHPILIEPPTAVTVCKFREAVLCNVLSAVSHSFYRKTPQVPLVMA
jgi:hypothetical protein